MQFDVDWVDAFADRPFGGNGCAVVHGGAGLDDATCMAFVRETGLVECTFTGPSDSADVRVRYFLADREIPFAGHPTVATVAALVHRGHIAGEGAVTLETVAGAIPVEVARRAGGGAVVTMTQNRPDFGAEVPGHVVAGVMGLSSDDIVGQPRIVSTGLPFCIAVVRDRAVLDRAVLYEGALVRFRAAFPHPDADIMEPFLVILGGATPEGDTYARLLLAPPNPPEDPFTGSATGCMAAYLWQAGLIETPHLVAEQGHGMGRPGQARVEVLGPRDDIRGVRVAGPAHVLISGVLTL